jgi:hypothetical protein
VTSCTTPPSFAVVVVPETGPCAKPDHTLFETVVVPIVHGAPPSRRC